MNGSDRRRHIGGSLMIALGIVAGAMSLTSAAQAAVTTQTVPLNNDQAGFENDCPSEPGDYWHFVTAPNNNTFEFVEITLTVGGTTVTASGAAIIPNGGQLDNVFVRVPTGFGHGDLSTTGSFALITPDTGQVRFVLSHLCTVGSTVTTAPTTTTSTTSTTTTTAPTSSTSTTAPTSSTTSTTTAAAVTSTTAPAVTSTTTASGGGAVTTTTDASAVTTTTDLSGSGGATTTSVASGGAVATTTSPAAAATTTSVASAAVTTAAPASTPLPATGSNLTGTLAVLSLLAITIGGVLLALSRGTRRPDRTVT